MNDPQAAKLLDKELTGSIIGAFYDVYDDLPFGHAERIYALAMQRALVELGHQVQREVSVMVYFRGKPLALEKLDMIVDRRVVLEIKATERLHESGTLQLFSYL